MPTPNQTCATRALLFSIAAHAVALTLLVLLDSLWLEKRRSSPHPPQVTLVARERAPQRSIEPEIASPPVPPRRAPGEMTSRPKVKPRPADKVSAPPPETLSTRDRNPHDSVVLRIERYRRGDLADSMWAGLDPPEERARELAFEMINASFRELRPAIEAEMFLEAFRCNFPYMR